MDHLLVHQQEAFEIKENPNWLLDESDPKLPERGEIFQINRNSITIPYCQ